MQIPMPSMPSFLNLFNTFPVYFQPLEQDCSLWRSTSGAPC